MKDQMMKEKKEEPSKDQKPVSPQKDPPQNKVPQNDPEPKTPPLKDPDPKRPPVGEPLEID